MVPVQEQKLSLHRGVSCPLRTALLLQCCQQQSLNDPIVQPELGMLRAVGGHKG